jgi:hypothetical protein
MKIPNHLYAEFQQKNLFIIRYKIFYLYVMHVFIDIRLIRKLLYESSIYSLMIFFLETH